MGAFARVSIHSFGYRANWTERKESLSSIHDFARSLLNAIYCDSGIHEREVSADAIVSRLLCTLTAFTTKIVFVAHSMGGIVARKVFPQALAAMCKF